MEKILINETILEDFHLEIPSFELCKGECKELVLSHSVPEQIIADKIIEIAERQGEFMIYANQLTSYRNSIWDSIFRRKSADILARVCHLNKTQAEQICKANNISPEEDFGSIQRNDRKILDLEVCTLKSDFIVVDDSGHDPSGLTRLSRHIEAMIRRNIGILLLQVPLINRSKKQRWDNPVRVRRLSDELDGRSSKFSCSYSLQSVEHVFITNDHPILDLTLTWPGGGETLRVTAEHPVWVEAEGWVVAGYLRSGDKVARADAGGWATVQSLRGPPGKETVYNFVVATTHTYFVGSGATWVHNGGPCGDVPEIVREEIASAMKALSWPKNGSPLDGTLRFKCDECANVAKRILKKHKIRGDVYNMKNTAAHINAEDLPEIGRIISTTGNHKLIKVGETFFDNIHPNGVQASEWMDGALSIPGTKIVPQIIGRFL